MTEALRRAFAEAAAGGRVGALKEVMTAQYTRLAQLTEDLIARLVQDTEVRSALFAEAGYAENGETLRVLLPICRPWYREQMHTQARMCFASITAGGLENDHSPCVDFTCTVRAFQQGCEPLRRAMLSL